MPHATRSPNDPRKTRWLRALVTALVLSSLMVHGVGVSLLRAAAMRTESEETSEESKGEVELRELSYKCARVRVGVPHRTAARAIRLLHDESQPGAPNLPPQQVAAHLVGAGVCLRC